MRNPWSRLVSTYSHLKREIESPAEVTFFRRNKPLENFAQFVQDAEDFLKGKIKARSPFEGSHLWPQVDYIPHYRKKFFGVKWGSSVKLNHCGRVENFSYHFNQIMKDLGLEIPEPNAVNTSTSNIPWRKFYTPSLFNQVAELYAEDVEYFDYTRDE